MPAGHGTEAQDLGRHRPVMRGRTPTVTAATDLLTAARAEALFLSDLSAGSEVTAEQIAAAIRRTVRSYGGTRGCAGEALARYCHCPEIGVPRMRWARRVVEAAYAAGPTTFHPAALLPRPPQAKAA
jgi:hypothetical protein